MAVADETQWGVVVGVRQRQWGDGTTAVGAGGHGALTSSCAATVHRQSPRPGRRISPPSAVSRRAKDAGGCALAYRICCGTASRSVGVCLSVSPTTVSLSLSLSPSECLCVYVYLPLFLFLSLYHVCLSACLSVFPNFIMSVALIISLPPISFPFKRSHYSTTYHHSLFFFPVSSHSPTPSSVSCPFVLLYYYPRPISRARLSSVM